MNTYSKHLVFIIEDWKTVLAFRYDVNDVPEPICPIRADMTLADLLRSVEDWEDR